jgi:Ca2+-binding RTX toxin-like protein
VNLFTPIRFITYSILILILISAVTAIAATNTVPSTRVTNRGEYISINNLKPAACASMDLTHLVTGSGVITGTAGSDLILGSSGADVIDGLGGNDCILGGGGDDALTGNDGNDICLRGTGNDILTTCEVEQ